MTDVATDMADHEHEQTGVGPQSELGPGAVTGSRGAADLVEPGGVNAGSVAAERDRRPSGDIDVGEVDGDLERDAPPTDEVVGVPGDELSQQLAAGEG